jgi:hypothetical protein
MKAGHNWIQHPVIKERYKMLAECDRTFKNAPPVIMSFLRNAILAGKYDE